MSSDLLFGFGNDTFIRIDAEKILKQIFITPRNVFLTSLFSKFISYCKIECNLAIFCFEELKVDKGERVVGWLSRDRSRSRHRSTLPATQNRAHFVMPYDLQTLAARCRFNVVFSQGKTILI